MNKIVCFAHYDKNKKIENYVVYYLQELCKIADKIIFVSDSYIEDNELKKIEPYVIKIIAKPHGEYDFGSYKRGFLYAKENNLLQNCDELIFANDSCYAPVFPFQEMFDKMSKKNIDFWGASENNCGYKKAKNRFVYCKIKHIQSYFMVFKKNVFNSDVFLNFINSIQKLNSKEEIIYNYEIGLSKLLTNNNFKFDTYSDICKKTKTNNGSILEYKKLIKQEHFPFLKRSINLFKNSDIVLSFGIDTFIRENTKYNYELLKQDRINNQSLTNIRIFYNTLKCIKRKIIRLSLNKHDIRLIIFGKRIFNMTKTEQELL